MDSETMWATSMWAMLNDEGVWGVPRSGLMYRKDEGEMQLVLYARMPWMDDMPGSPEALLSFQDQDHAGIRDCFARIGVEVVEKIEDES